MADSASRVLAKSVDRLNGKKVHQQMLWWGGQRNGSIEIWQYPDCFFVVRHLRWMDHRVHYYPISHDGVGFWQHLYHRHYLSGQTINALPDSVTQALTTYRLPITIHDYARSGVVKLLKKNPREVWLCEHL